MSRFFANLKKYGPYARYSAIASLRAEVSGSYFSWMWWILDPFLFMMVYSFVALIVFGRSEPHFVPFVFIGYGAWSYFNRCVSQSVRLIRGNKSILARVYLPKYMLVVSMVLENLVQFLITVALSLIMAGIDHVQFTWLLLWYPVLIVLMTFFIFGVCCVMAHVGVYAKDMSNVITVVLKLMFYLSGVFYSIANRVPDPYGKWLLRLNPVAMYMNQMRNVTLYGEPPRLLLLLVWLVVSILLTMLGVHLIHRHEQSYVKAI